MTNRQLFAAIGEIDDVIINEASTARINSVKQPWLKFAGVAAAFALIIAGAVMLPKILAPVEPAPDLPKLNAAYENYNAMGFEGHMAYDISELNSGNPWDVNNKITQLPVFINTMIRDRYGLYDNGLTAEEMLEKVQQAAQVLGLEVGESYTVPTLEQIEMITEKIMSMGDYEGLEQDIAANTAVQNATVKCTNGVRIEITPDGYLRLYLTLETADLVYEADKLLEISDSFVIWFDPVMQLPGEYNFTYDYAGDEQALEVTQYLLSQYGAFAGIQQPGYNLFADYNIYAERMLLYYTVFENSGSPTEQLLNHQFNNIHFSPSDEGGMSAIRYNKTDLSELVGYYPIITAEEARELLVSGEYYSSVPYDITGAENIGKVEMVYHTSPWNEMFIPYYKFYVEVELGNLSAGMKQYGVYYVSAIHPDYIESTPINIFN
ncbi:MAG: hypothetical protein FWD34_06765 [Oscillospiraceae bacterium]|nr:hypothetical protein [Oscillospiraceae bacterium]